MNNFERTINKWRTATDTNIKIDGKDGAARATIKLDMATVTVLSNVRFEGKPFYIEPDDLKTIKRVDDLRLVNDSQFVGDLTVDIPERKEEEELEPVEFTPGDYFVARDDLDYVLTATSTDLTRPVLNAVCFTKEHMVSTDGYRLHFAHGEYYQGETDLPLLPNHILGRIKSDFRITHNDNHSVINFEDRDNKVIVKIDWMVGTFPDYRAIVPSETKIKFRIPEDKRLKKVIGDKIGIVTLGDTFQYETREGKYTNICTTFTLEPEYIEGKPEEPVKFGINPKILYEAIREWPAEIGFNAPNTPIVVDGSVAMPMHIGD